MDQAKDMNPLMINPEFTERLFYLPVNQAILEDGTHPVSDVNLLPMIASGDTSAVRKCLDRYGGLVWSLARRFLGNTNDAEDAVQEIFFDLWRNAGKFDAQQASEKTFITLIARRRLIDLLRKKNRQPIPEAFPETDVAEPTKVSATLDIQEEAQRVLQVLSELKPEQQQILKLSILSGWTHEQIASQLNMPLGTVKTHIRRGLQQIRDRLDCMLSTHNKKGGPTT